MELIRELSEKQIVILLWKYCFGLQTTVSLYLAILEVLIIVF